MRDIVRLLKLMRPWAGWIVLGVFFSIITLIANVTLMAMSGWFIASMAMAGLAGVSMNYFTPGAIIRAMAITRTVGRYVDRLITHEATLRLVAHLRRWFYDRLEPLAPAALQSKRSGDLFSRIGGDISVLENFYLRTLVPVLVALVALPVFLIFIASYSGTFAAGVAILYAIAGLGLPLVLHRLGKQAGQDLVLHQAAMRTELTEGLQGMREMLVYGRKDDFEAALGGQSEDLRQSQRRLSGLHSVSQSLLTFAANLSVLLAMFTIIPRVQSELLSGPILPMLALFVLASFEAILPLPLAVQSYITTQMAARRLFSLADREPLVAEPLATCDSEVDLPIHDHCPDLEFKGVTLRYPGEDAPVLQNISLSLPAKRNIAITGPSGSGKSSLINALTGFWPLEDGQIFVDEKRLHSMPGMEQRSYFAVAAQKPHIFNSTLRGNLMLANETADEEALERVCATVHLDDFIASLEDGLDTFVGEAGKSLSGGQIRRLAIARALLSPAPILILDEPGEGLDPQTEQRILKNIANFAVDRSIILITHSHAGLQQDADGEALFETIYSLNDNGLSKI